MVLRIILLQNTEIQLKHGAEFHLLLHQEYYLIISQQQLHRRLEII